MTLKVKTYDSLGKKGKQSSLPKVVFGQKPNDQLMAQAVRVYLFNQKTARPKTKSRSEVVGSTRKIWAQKGTGRARHGALTAPIFVGGGIAHGPKGTPATRLKMSKKMRRQALLSALSWQAKNQNLVVLSDEKKTKGKTKNAQKMLDKIFDKQARDKILLVTHQPDKNLIRSVKNLPNLKLINANNLNCYTVLNAQKIIITKNALKQVKNLFGK